MDMKKTSPKINKIISMLEDAIGELDGLRDEIEEKERKDIGEE